MSFVIKLFLLRDEIHFSTLGSLSNYDNDGNKNVTNLHI